ncbi:MAG: DUF4349 domain-containing protein [Defluviitaleaceae bacterium]|nr:DUF4349 domain-containing protein [Defluviitaleaceae bacterium]
MRPSTNSYNDFAISDAIEYSISHGFSDYEGSIGDIPVLTPGNEHGIRLTYVVNFDLQTTAFMEGSRILLNATGEMGGYSLRTHISGRDMYGSKSKRSANYHFKIPTERLNEFQIIMEDNFNLLNMIQDAQDITERYEGEDRQLDLLRQRETEFSRLIGQADDPDDRASLERERGNIRTQIASLETSASSMDRQIVFSDVKVNLYEVIAPEEIPDETWGDRLGQTVKSGLNLLKNFLQDVVVILISLVPVLIILAVLCAMAWPIVIAVRRIMAYIKQLRRVKPPEHTEE